MRSLTPRTPAICWWLRPRAGGELVYRHGAASVYQQDGTATPPAAAAENGRASEREDNQEDDD